MSDGNHNLHWDSMRHSSWTLFLVPLALALVILCMPGTLKTTSRIDSPSKGMVEFVQDEPTALSEAVTSGFGSGGETSQESSESLYKE